MNQAVRLAWKGMSKVGSNPMVGAVFVKNGVIIAEGYHRQFGDDHAEVEAIKQAISNQKSLKGTTLYVTLEPCCHCGKKGPCTEALIKIKPKKVIYAQVDPNPLVSGKGIAILEQNKIECVCGSTLEAKQLNEFYNVNVKLKRPFIHLKTVATLDGKITLKKGKSTSLGSRATSVRVHKIRNCYDGILIGFNTLKIDNPRLTVRLTKGVNPIRIILDSALRTPFSAQIFQEKGRNILATTRRKINSKWGKMPQVTILSCKKNSQGKIDLNDLLPKLFKMGIRSILVEGGEMVNTSFLQEKLVDRVSFIYTPKIAKNSRLPAIFKASKILPLFLKNMKIEKVGQDFWIQGEMQSGDF